MNRKFFILSFLPFILFAKEGGYENIGTGPNPWFTGPLVAPPANIVLPGHYNIEPNQYLYAYTAQYNNDWKAEDVTTYWSLRNQTVIELGILKWFDVVLIPNFYWNYRDGASHWEVGDSSAILNFQIYRTQLPHKNWLPSIKIAFKEIFPIGNYRNLKPKKLGTDIGGTGSFISSVELLFSKLFYFRNFHFLNLRAAFSFDVPAPVHVKGINFYGGSLDTNGVVYPGIKGTADFAFEYSLTRNWVLAFDAIGTWSAKTRFSSKNGKPLGGVSSSGGLSASAQYSVAPAIEYNFSQNLGIIFGSWFTIAGKNANKYVSGIVAINISN